MGIESLKLEVSKGNALETVVLWRSQLEGGIARHFASILVVEANQRRLLKKLAVILEGETFFGEIVIITMATPQGIFSVRVEA